MECPACRSADTRLHDRRLIETTVDRYFMHACGSCGTRFAVPRTPAPGDWYADTGEWYGWRWEFDECLAELTRLVPPGSRILEIGCGEGGVLQKARELGFRVVGNDINPVALREALRSGLDVVEGNLADVCQAIPTGSLQAVLMFHVLEHVPAPRDFLRQLATLLAPGGWLFVSVPNPDRVSAKVVHEVWDDPPHHLTRFSEDGFRAALAAAGLQVRDVKREPLDTNAYRLASLRADEVTGPLPATPVRYAKKLLPFVVSLPGAMLACRHGSGTAMYAAASRSRNT